MMTSEHPRHLKSSARHGGGGVQTNDSNRRFFVDLTDLALDVFPSSSASAADPTAPLSSGFGRHDRDLFVDHLCPSGSHQPPSDTESSPPPPTSTLQLQYATLTHGPPTTPNALKPPPDPLPPAPTPGSSLSSAGGGGTDVFGTCRHGPGGIMTIDPDLALFLGTDVTDSDAFSVTSTSTQHHDHALVPEPLLFPQKSKNDASSRRVRRDRNGFPETSAFFDPDNVSDEEKDEANSNSSNARKSHAKDRPFLHGQDAADVADKNALFDLPSSTWSVAPASLAPAAHSTTTSRSVSETAGATPTISVPLDPSARALKDKNSIFDMDFSVTPAPAPPTPAPSLASSTSSIFTRRSQQQQRMPASDKNSSFFFDTMPAPAPAPTPPRIQTSVSATADPPAVPRRKSIFDEPPSPVLPATLTPVTPPAIPSFARTDRPPSPSKHLLPGSPLPSTHSTSPILIPLLRSAEPPPVPLRDTGAPILSLQARSLWANPNTGRFRSSSLASASGNPLTLHTSSDGSANTLHPPPSPRRRSATRDAAGMGNTNVTASLDLPAPTTSLPTPPLSSAAALTLQPSDLLLAWDPIDPASFILHYVPLRKNLLGEGLHATVYRGTYVAHAGAPERACAVKVLNPDSEESQATGLLEAALLHLCRHPNIVRAIDIVDVANYPWDVDKCGAMPEGFTRLTLANLPFPPPSALLSSSIVKVASRDPEWVEHARKVGKAKREAAAAASAHSSRASSVGNLSVAGVTVPPLPRSESPVALVASSSPVPSSTASSSRSASRAVSPSPTLSHGLSAAAADSALAQRAHVACPQSPEYVLVLELCEGGSLWSYVRTHPTTVGRRRWMRWARQLAQAVATMHAHRIVHHDIKPQNILLDEFQGIKLSDLGGAEVVPRQGFFDATVGKGTLAFMAPELVNQLPYNASVDIYSLGVTLFVVGILGHEPFLGCSSPVQLLMAVARGFWNWPTNVPEPARHSRMADRVEDPDTRGVNPGMHLRRGVPHPHAPNRFLRFLNGDLVDSGIWDLLTRCMNADSEMRPTAAELVAELRGLDGLEVDAAEL